MTTKVFCAAPWAVSHVTAAGFRSPCCCAHKSYDYETLDEYWNSPELRELRVKMMAGETDTETCKTCVFSRKSAILKDYYNEQYADIIAAIPNTTTADGFTTQRPVEFEVKHIACNLRCRICSNQHSSAIYTDERKMFPLKEIKFGSVYGENFKFKDSVDDLCDDNLKIARRISWAGGEPFMSPVIVKTLERLIALGNTNLIMSSNTNLIFPNEQRARKIISLLSQFPKFNLSVSIDGTGENGAFGRSGWDEATCVKNIELIRELAPKMKMSATVVVTAVSVIDLVNIYKFCMKHSLIFKAQLVSLDSHRAFIGEIYNGSSYNDYMDFCIIRKDVIDAETDALIKEVEKDHETMLTPSYIEQSRKNARSIVASINKAYVPRVFTEAVREQLNNHNKTRGQYGVFERLTEGKRNEVQ